MNGEAKKRQHDLPDQDSLIRVSTVISDYTLIHCLNSFFFASLFITCGLVVCGCVASVLGAPSTSSVHQAIVGMLTGFFFAIAVAGMAIVYGLISLYVIDLWTKTTSVPLAMTSKVTIASALVVFMAISPFATWASLWQVACCAVVGLPISIFFQWFLLRELLKQYPRQLHIHARKSDVPPKAIHQYLTTAPDFRFSLQSLGIVIIWISAVLAVLRALTLVDVHLGWFTFSFWLLHAPFTLLMARSAKHRFKSVQPMKT